MDKPEKKAIFSKFLPDRAIEQIEELKGTSGYVGNVSNPYDRLKHRLSRLFGPQYPSVFDVTEGGFENAEADDRK